MNGRKAVRHTPFAVDRSRNVSQCYRVRDLCIPRFLPFFFFLSCTHFCCTKMPWIFSLNPVILDAVRYINWSRSKKTHFYKLSATKKDVGRIEYEAIRSKSYFAAVLYYYFHNYFRFFIAHRSLLASLDTRLFLTTNLYCTIVEKNVTFLYLKGTSAWKLRSWLPARKARPEIQSSRSSYLGRHVCFTISRKKHYLYALCELFRPMHIFFAACTYVQF